MALGLVGEYVWRGLDEARARPAYLIEALAGIHEPASFEQEFGGREAIQARQPASTR
jgi:hypothetical protein